MIAFAAPYVYFYSTVFETVKEGAGNRLLKTKVLEIKASEIKNASLLRGMKKARDGDRT